MPDSRTLFRSTGLTLILVLIALSASQSVYGQVDAQATVSSSERRFVVEKIDELLNAHYVFPDVAAETAEHIQARHAAGAYDAINDYYELAETLTADLQFISNDGHMNVNLNPADSVNATNPIEREAERQQQLLASQRDNFAFRKLEWLPGNVVFLELRSFRHTDEAGPTAVAAMNFMANADAIIIDLRSNHGGDPSMVQLISSYFFDERIHLNSFQMRDETEIDQKWTLPHVPGRKLSDTPLFILTGWYTYSAAEEFAYNMKALKRATLIGSTTGGAAHPTHNYRINDNFAVSIPFGRAVNPVTGTNWEGVGVEPDIEIGDAGYLDGRTIAHLEALKVIDATLENGWYRESIRSQISILEAEIRASEDE